jgi:hypothetical protein
VRRRRERRLIVGDEILELFGASKQLLTARIDQ